MTPDEDARQSLVETAQLMEADITKLRDRRLLELAPLIAESKAAVLSDGRAVIRVDSWGGPPRCRDEVPDVWDAS